MVTITTEMIKEAIVEMIDEVVEGEMGDVESNEVCYLTLSVYVYINVCLLYLGECFTTGAECCEKSGRGAMGCCGRG